MKQLFLSISLLFFITFKLTAQIDFDWDLKLGANSSLGNRKKIGITERVIDNQTMMLTPKYNPRFFRFMILPVPILISIPVSKGTTGGKNIHCNNSTMDFFLEGTIGLKSQNGIGLNIGVSYFNKNFKDFYFTNKETSINFMEQTKVSTLAFPVQLSVGDEQGLFSAYFKMAYEKNLNYTQTQYLNGESITTQEVVSENSKIKMGQLSYGLGANFGPIFMEANFLPSTSFNKNYQEGLLNPYTNQPDRRLFYRAGLRLHGITSMAKAARHASLSTPRTSLLTALDLGSLYEGLKDMDKQSFWGLTGRMKFKRGNLGYPYPQVQQVKMLTPRGIVDVKEACETCDALTWSPWDAFLNMGIFRKRAGFLNTYLSLEHVQFKKNSLTYVLEPTSKQVVTISDNSKINGIRLGLDFQKSFFFVGARLSWMYRYNRVLLEGDEEFKKYVEVIPKESVRPLTVGLVTGIQLFGIARAYWEYYPLAPYNENYTDDNQLKPYSALKKYSSTFKVAFLLPLYQ